MDYELFFGETPGSVEKCLLYPTDKLCEICRKHNVRMTFFVDVGYLISLEKFKNKYPELEQDYLQVTTHLKALEQEGHAIQLHIHPHWEASFYDGQKWNMVVDNHYKLTDFSDDEILEIFKRYKEKLSEFTHQPLNSFRAGGWCIQPFERIKPAFEANGIQFDSSVFSGGYFETKHYFFDFRKAPYKGRYQFEDDVCVETQGGKFTELPIGGWRYSPLFYWKLYALGRINPAAHKFIGDGSFVPQPGRKMQHLRKSSWNHVSCDGYFTQKLKKITKRFSKEGRSDLVIIGHPKSATAYSIKKLEKYIAKHKHNYSFLTFNDL